MFIYTLRAKGDRQNKQTVDSRGPLATEEGHAVGDSRKKETAGQTQRRQKEREEHRVLYECIYVIYILYIL